MKNIYELRSVSRRDEKIHYWGAEHTIAEAEARLLEKTTGEKRAWADEYHSRWWIEKIETTGMFEIPSSPPPRELYSVNLEVVESAEGYTNTLMVNVEHEQQGKIASYSRNHSGFYQTFEPFRQGARLFALVSRDYTTTAVMDLETGEIVASEAADESGFCPVGFYVPDWWDLNDGSTLPGSHYWTKDDEEPKGHFGFVWGCIWGDDTSWKVQYLDLSRVQEGKISRDDRFGYVELASHPKLNPQDFIRCYFSQGVAKVEFSVYATHDLASGKREPHEFE